MMTEFSLDLVDYPEMGITTLVIFHHFPEQKPILWYILLA